ncbi:OstA-like protein [Pedobacter sp. MW01-1-1]|uniref:OstA-like protein n=1 Tax=Pedobacter sp. MW01-1-1 TaxID=3383027 RepID=UPI003FF0F3B7
MRGDIKNNISYILNGVFQQDNATLTCDSAIFYTKKNSVEMHKNVHINQLTTDIYSDELQYDGHKKHAHFTGNVRMQDPTMVLTTNILDYNTNTKIGTYTNGGKIVNQSVTLTSKNGKYESYTNDSYFRYNVLAVTPQATIKSDTLRYNTGDFWTYFYGPTNIKGKDDNMYTENGRYNTKTENAYFGKRNLYTQGTRSLKGDSLHYDGSTGIGEAVRNIVFTDTKDNIKIRGNLGYYYKKDQRTLVTRGAYMSVGTQDSIIKNGKKMSDTLWLGADTLEAQMVLQKSLKLIPKISIQADNEIGEDEDTGSKEPKYKGETEIVANTKSGNNKKAKNKNANPTEQKDVKTASLSPDLTEKTDSVALDSLSKQKINTKNDSLQNTLDSVAKSTLDNKKDSIQKQTATTQSQNKKTAINPSGTPVKAPAKPAKGVVNPAAKNIKNIGLKPDTTKFNPADTVQTRSIKAYHNAKLFKTNIQSKTDSIFYTSADSTLRCYGNPIIWSDGSQQVADTMYIQFKQSKINNFQAIRNAFVVNTPKDSLRFNQIKGRLITGFFEDGKVKNLYVDGNAESIYYTQDEKTKVYKDMNQSISSRIKFIFKDNEVQEITLINKAETATQPDVDVAKDHVLKGFSWKPAERPKAKKDVIGSSGKTTPKKSAAKSAPSTKPKGKTPTPKTSSGAAKPASEKNVEVKSVAKPVSIK